MGKIFISYAHADKKRAIDICDSLIDLGFDAWIDRRDLPANADFTSMIDDKITTMDVVLVLWSAAAKQSMWVKGEALRGLEYSRYFGALIDRVSPPVPFNSLNAPDLTEWSAGHHAHSGWDALVSGMTAMSPSSSSRILKKLREAQERLAAATATQVAAIQEALPLGDLLTEEEIPEAAATGPQSEPDKYQDVESILSAAKSLIASDGKLELPAVILQAALDQEMLRDARFVVGPNPGIPAPAPSKCTILGSLEEAVKESVDGDLIVILSGSYPTNAHIDKNIRIVGLGWGKDRPTLVAKKDWTVLNLRASARVENVNVKAESAPAIICGVETKPVLLRCSVTCFSKVDVKGDNAAVHVGGQAILTMMASSITTAYCKALRFVGGAGGTFLGVSIIASRGAAVLCRGKPQFHGCTIEAIGGHAVEVRGIGNPDFDSCEISGRGKSVIYVTDWARPKIRSTHVKALDQRAFDFEGESSGVFEANVFELQSALPETSIKPKTGIFGPKKPAVTPASEVLAKIMSLKTKAKPLFISNTMKGGEKMPEPPAAGKRQ